ncbi:MAG TPA: hypothetical protein VG186_15520 [Solirubrobacteraceae bacterium]|nr:hypothetical protein [Solirubrobacteraceae bacterium]
MTPFAAGCALCGAALDPKRWQKPAPLGSRLSLRLPRWRARRRRAVPAKSRSFKS